MINYYEILEVSEKASPEVIEKAYKVLAKKYHPDLQQPANKISAEQKMKEINAAYEVLSNTQKRQELDESLAYNRKIDKEKREQEILENIEMQNTTNQVSTVQQENERPEHTYNMTPEEKKNYNKQIKKQKENSQKQLNNQYQELYNDYLRKLGYRVKEKWTWKRFLKVLEALGIFALIIVVLWIIPPTRNLIISFYEENPIIKVIVDTIGKIIQVIWNTIANVFTNTKQI